MCMCVVFPSRISMNSLNYEKKNFELFVEEPSPWFLGDLKFIECLWRRVYSHDLQYRWFIVSVLVNALFKRA